MRARYLGALGRQHAPSQQILAPGMQRRQSEFAFAGARVYVALLAVREVPVGLRSLQSVLFRQRQTHSFQVLHAAEAPPSGFSLAGHAEPRNAALQEGPRVEAGAGGRSQGGACAETRPGPCCHAAPRVNAFPPVVIFRDVAGIHLGDGRLWGRVPAQVRIPALVLVEVVVQSFQGAPGPLPPLAQVAELLLHVHPQILGGGGPGGRRGGGGRQERRGQAGGRGLRRPPRTRLAAPSQFAAQVGGFPSGLHGVLHHEVQQALLTLKELGNRRDQREANTHTGYMLSYKLRYLIGQQTAALVSMLGPESPLAQHVVSSDLDRLGQPAVKQGLIQGEGLGQTWGRACTEEEKWWEGERERYQQVTQGPKHSSLKEEKRWENVLVLVDIICIDQRTFTRVRRRDLRSSLGKCPHFTSEMLTLGSIR